MRVTGGKVPSDRAAAGCEETARVTTSELEQFYELYFLPLVRRAVRKHGLSFEDAGDVTQDAFVLAVAKLDPKRNPKAWLYQVVDHLAVNLRRKSLRRATLMARWQFRHESARAESGDD